MNQARFGQTASVLSNGQVLTVRGSNIYGQTLTSAEFYTPQ